MSGRRISRREFVRGSIAGAAVFTIVPRHVLGGKGYNTPSETITRGVLGTGSRGTGGHVVQNKSGSPPVTLAVCDVDNNHLSRALRRAGRPCQGYTDFRHVLERKDIDTIHIATPPHWHAIMSIAAAQAGKDILCEKPLTRFIGEGLAVIENVRHYGRILQLGTYGRFGRYHRYGTCKELRKLICGGFLGSPVTVRVTKKLGFEWKVERWSGRTHLPPQQVPGVLDYDMWLGPSPVKPYHPHRVHRSFRGYWDYDGGGLADMGQHYLDPIQYFLNKDDTSPMEVEAYAPWPQHDDAVGMWGRVKLTYDNGDAIILESGEWGEPEEGKHTFLEGPKGKVYVNYETDPPGLFDKARKLPDPPPLVDFVTAIKTRKQPGGNESVAHRSSALLHLSNIAIRVGRKLRFDPVKHEFPGEQDANRLVHQPMRAPWHL